MCGIVGAVSNRNIVPILIEGLKRLEYRGYDSCGVAVHQDGQLKRARSTSRVAELEAGVAQDGIASGTGIAHTRWATHGAPEVHNAHPHFSRNRIALVHNGIIENHDELRAELQQARLRLHQPDRHRGHRPPGGPPVRRRPVRRRAARHAAAEGRLRHRRVLPRRAAARGGRARRLAADPGPGQGRELPGQRRHGAGRRDRPDRLPGRRRRGRPAAGQDLDRRAPGRRPLQGRAARSAHGGGAQRRGRAGPVPALHAKGDLRAAARHCRHAGRPGRDHRHQPRAVRRRRLQGLQGRGAGADPGLRHQLLQRQHRQVLAGVDRRHPHQRGDRQRIPLPRQRAQPEDAGRHHQPERRDRRHAGRAEARARPGHAAHADHLQRGHQRDGARMQLRLHHARRGRGGRGLDQGLHHAAGGPVPADAGAGAGARPAERRAGSSST